MFPDKLADYMRSITKMLILILSCNEKNKSTSLDYGKDDSPFKHEFTKIYFQII